MNPVISVIVPVYNSESTIIRCIESVLNQTYTSFELLLIDDGSDDNGGSICDDYAKKDPRITVIHQENKGVSAARNAGLDIAAGQYVFFLDSDDELYPITFSRYMELVDQHQVDAVLGSMEFINDKAVEVKGFSTEALYSSDVWEEICMNSQVFGWAGAKMFSRDAIRDTRFDEKMSSQEDLSFNLDVYKQCKCIICTPFAGYKYYYSNAKRNPQIIDYVKNQVKLLQYAEENYTITDKAKTRVLERIVSMAYTALYNTDSKTDYCYFADELFRLRGMDNVLSEAKKHQVKHINILQHISSGAYRLPWTAMRIRKKMVSIIRTTKK